MTITGTLEVRHVGRAWYVDLDAPCSACCYDHVTARVIAPEHETPSCRDIKCPFCEEWIWDYDLEAAAEAAVAECIELDAAVARDEAERVP